jgi:photosystem II stability/assembly factor-like uncharacterized protein
MATGTNKYQWKKTSAPLAQPHAFPDGRTDDIWFFDDQTGWLVNSNGQVMKTENGGESWDEKFYLDPCMGSRPSLRSMGWGSRSVGWFGVVATQPPNNPTGYLSVLLHHTTDGGETWTAVQNLPTCTPEGICGFYAVNEQVAYGSGTNDPTKPRAIIKTTNGGGQWEVIDMTPWADSLIDIYFENENTGWVVGGKTDADCEGSGYDQLRPVVLKTTDGGKTWENRAAGVQGFKCGEWGWKIQFINARVGFVTLENFNAAAILKTTDGGESWVRLPIIDTSDKRINNDLEGVGFLNESEGWVGGWGYYDFAGKANSYTTDGGTTWMPQNYTGYPGGDPRRRINRYRFIRDDSGHVIAGYCCGTTVYKLYTDESGTQAEAHPQAAMVHHVAPANSFALSHVPYGTDRSDRLVEISYTLSQDAERVCIGLWNRFAFHVRTLLDGESQTAGRYTIVWDGKDDNGEPVEADVYMCRISVDNQRCESQFLRLLV